MPQGPFGLPRITSIGPFSKEVAKEMLSIKVTDSLAPETGIPRELIDDGVISSYESERVEIELNSGSGDVVAKATYSKIKDSPIAIVGKIEVEENMRSEGIGTDLKKILIQDMSRRGVEKAYTVIATEDGRSLAERTGFTRDTGLFKDDDSVLSRSI